MLDEGVLGGDDAGAGGIFPFLSVLICTIGVMVFILVTGFLKQSMTEGAIAQLVRDKHASVLGQHRKVKATHVALSERRKNIRNAVSLTRKAKAEASKFMMDTRKLSTEIQEKSGNIQAVRGSLEELEKQEAELKQRRLKFDSLRQMRAKGKLQSDLSPEHKKVTGEAQELKQRAADLEAEAKTLTEEHDSLNKELDQPEVEFKFEGMGKDASPVVIDIHSDKVLVLYSPVDGIETPPAGGPAVAREFFESLASRLATKATKHYALLLIRPNAAAQYYEARRAFLKWRAPFRHEPFEEKWIAGPVPGQ